MTGLHSSILCLGALLLVLPTVQNIPIGVPSTSSLESQDKERIISNVKDIEGEVKKAVLLGKLKEAFLLEELLENEVIKANLNLLVDGEPIKRDVSVRQKRAVELLNAVLGSNTGSTEPSAADNANTIDAISSGLTLLSSLLSSSSGKSNALVRKKRQDPSDNDVLGTEDGDGGETEDPSTAEQSGIMMNANISNESGSGDGDLTFPGGSDEMMGGGARDELVSTLTGLSSPLSEFSMGGATEGSGEDGEGGGVINPNTVLNLIGPLLTSLSGGGGEDGGGLIGPDVNSLVSLAGSLSSAVIGGLSNEGSGGGGSDVAGIVTGLAGQLSASSSGGSGDGDGSDITGVITSVAGSLSASSSGGGGENGTSEGSNVGSLIAGVVGPLSASSSGGNPDGPGGFNVVGAVAGLAGPLSASISGGGDSDSDGGGGSGGSGSLLTGLLGSSSGGGGGISGSSDSSNDDNQVDTAGGGSDLFGLLGSLSGAIGGSEGANGEEGGSSGSGLISLLANVIASTSAGTGDGASGGGGSGSFISSILGASSGGGGGDSAGGFSSGGGDFKTQIFSLLFRLKLAVFQSLLSLVTGASASSSGAKF